MKNKLRRSRSLGLPYIDIVLKINHSVNIEF